MNFIRIEYDIAIFERFIPQRAYRERVAGYAFELDGNRLCVRRVVRNFWSADDYVTGFAVGCGRTRADAILAARNGFARRSADEVQRLRASAFAQLKKFGLL